MNGFMSNSFIGASNTLCFTFNFFQDVTKIGEDFVFDVEELGPFFKMYCS